MASFLLSWKNKFLWVFGFLIFLSLVAENINLSKEDLLKNANVAGLFKQNENYFLLVGFFLLILVVIFYVLKILSTAALILALNNPKLYRQVKIRTVLGQMQKFLGRLVGLDLLLDFVGLILIVVLIFPVVLLFSLKAFLFGTIALAIAILILIPLLLLIFFLKKFSFMAVVLSDSKIKTVLEFSYEVFLKHLKESLLMGCWIFAAWWWLLILLALPLSTLYYFSSMQSWSSMGIFLTGIGVALLISLIISIFIVFIQGAWLYFFSQISMQEDLEKKTAEDLVTEKNKGENLSPDAA